MSNPATVSCCKQNRRILCVGLVCIDLVVHTCEYPSEDTDTRTISQEWQRGGNASNNCTILSCLGASCELFATLNDSTDLNCESFVVNFLKNDIRSLGICIENCVYHPDCGCPSSVVIINSQNGSRTILHQKKNLPELSFDDFAKLELNNYKWIHFEGRHSEEYSKMLKHVHEWNTSHSIDEKIAISVELEKTHIDYRLLSLFADVIFIGKDFAISKEYKCKEDVVRSFLYDLNPDAIVICPWGEDGAAARTRDGSVVVVKAFSPTKIVDTLGAGDTFLAAVIYVLANGYSLTNALTFGCRLAGEKCGMFGYTGLKTIALPLYEEIVVQSSDGQAIN